MNIVYDFARNRMLTGTLNWPSMVARMLVWGGSYTFVAGHTTVANVIAGAGGSPRAISLPATNKVATAAGYAKSDPILVQGLTPGPDITFYTLVEDIGGDVPTWRLIGYFDTGIDTPFSPNGLDWKIQPDWLAGRGWFRA